MIHPGDAAATDLAAALSRRYAIERELGRGGMGIVYLARDLTLDRQVALKVLPADLAGRPDIRERFLREAKTAAHLSHPNIVPIYHADETEGHAFFAMAYIDGESLAQRLDQRGPLPPHEAVRYLREVAWALAYAHARGVIHRDVKAENILIDRGSGRALVTDFGIARDGRQDSLTISGSVLGTVHYMSPEQAAGDFLDGRSDLYALGVVAYYILSGVFPFDADSASAILVAHVTQDARPLSSVAPSVPSALAAIIDRSLAKDPNDRYPAGEDFAEALDDALAATASRKSAKESGSDVVLDEHYASMIWRRAARLHADALLGLDGTLATESYEVRHVRGAAIEAGIGERFVALALAELPSEAHSGAGPLKRATWQERAAARLLGERALSCAVTRTVAAPAPRVLQVLGIALQQSPWDLTMRSEPVGGHPLDGGVLVLDIPRDSDSVNFSWRGIQGRLKAMQLRVAVRAAPRTPSSTEVTLYADLRAGAGGKAKAMWLWAGATGTVGATIGGTASGLLFNSTTWLSIVLSAMGIGVAGVIGALTAFRMSHRSAVKHARAEMSSALEGVSAGLKSRNLFGTTATTPRSMKTRRSRNDETIVVSA